MARRSSVSSTHGTRAAGKNDSTKRRIDHTDVPELSTTQLRSMRRVGRPPLGESTRQLIAFRIAPGLLRKLQAKAKATGIGYQTLMHQILAKAAARSV